MKWGAGDSQAPGGAHRLICMRMGNPGGFSCTVSFSHNVTNCCLGEPSVSLETGRRGGYARPLRTCHQPGLTHITPAPPIEAQQLPRAQTKAKYSGPARGTALTPHIRHHVLDPPTPTPIDLENHFQSSLVKNRETFLRRSSLHPLRSATHSSAQSCTAQPGEVARP